MNELFNPDVERVVLGMLMLDSSLAIKHHITPDYFHSVAYQLIFSAIIKVLENQGHANPIQISDTLLRDNTLNRVGGNKELANIYAEATEVENYEYYLNLLKDYHERREITKVSREVIEKVGTTGLELESLYDSIQSDFLSIQSKR